MDAISRQISQLEQRLTEKYGMAMEHHQLADLFHTSPASLRNTMRRSKEVPIKYLRYHKRRPGRKIFYLVTRVAEALVLGDRELEKRMQELSEGGPSHGL